MEMLLYLVPVFGILGLLFAAYLAARVGRQDAGNDRMKEIAAAISDGAQAFLTAEYKILVIFVAVFFIFVCYSDFFLYIVQNADYSLIIYNLFLPIPVRLAMLWPLLKYGLWLPESLLLFLEYRTLCRPGSGHLR